MGETQENSIQQTSEQDLWQEEAAMMHIFRRKRKSNLSIIAKGLESEDPDSGMWLLRGIDREKRHILSDGENVKNPAAGYFKNLPEGLLFLNSSY